MRARRSTASACASRAASCRQLVQATAPREFTQFARNPERSVVFGGANTIFAPAYGSPFVRDLDGGRRYGTIEDFRNFVKLAYVSPWLHHSGGTVCEPVDLPVNKRHYDMVVRAPALLRQAVHGLGDAPGARAGHRRAWHGSSSAPTSSSRTRSIFSLINANSPLVWDATMLGAARAYAEANQAVMMTPFILAGRDEPGHRRGDMRADARRVAGRDGVRASSSGPALPSCSAPSRARCRCSPARPPSGHRSLRSSSTSWPRSHGGSACRSAPAERSPRRRSPDAQAAYESANTMQPTMLGGVNFVLHAAGWLEGGLAMGYEKFVLDADQLGMWHAFVRGVDLSENGQALDAFLTNEPGTHFLGHRTRSRTSRRRSTARRSPTTRASSSGSPKGSLDAAQRANRTGSRRSRSTSRRRSTTRVDEELREWIEQKKASFPDSNV